MLILRVFLKPRECRKRSVSVKGLCVGVLLALLFYCKIKYFLSAAVLTALALGLELRPPHWFLSSAGAFVEVCVAFFAVFHGGEFGRESEVKNASVPYFDVLMSGKTGPVHIPPRRLAWCSRQFCGVECRSPASYRFATSAPGRVH